MLYGRFRALRKTLWRSLSMDCAYIGGYGAIMGKFPPSRGFLRFSAQILGGVVRVSDVTRRFGAYGFLRGGHFSRLFTMIAKLGTIATIMLGATNRKSRRCSGYVFVTNYAKMFK